MKKLCLTIFCLLLLGACGTAPTTPQQEDSSSNNVQPTTQFFIPHEGPTAAHYLQEQKTGVTYGISETLQELPQQENYFYDKITNQIGTIPLAEIKKALDADIQPVAIIDGQVVVQQQPMDNYDIVLENKIVQNENIIYITQGELVSSTKIDDIIYLILGKNTHLTIEYYLVGVLPDNSIKEYGLVGTIPVSEVAPRIHTIQAGDHIYVTGSQHFFEIKNDKLVPLDFGFNGDNGFVSSNVVHGGNSLYAIKIQYQEDYAVQQYISTWDLDWNHQSDTPVDIGTTLMPVYVYFLETAHIADGKFQAIGYQVDADSTATYYTIEMDLKNQKVTAKDITPLLPAGDYDIII